MPRLRRNRNERRRRRGIGGRIRRKILLSEAQAAKYIKLDVLGFDEVVAQAAAQDIAKIEMLQSVFVKIGKRKEVNSWPQIKLVAHSTMNGIGCGDRRRTGIISPVNLSEVNGQLVFWDNSRSLARNGEGGGRRVSLRYAEAKIKKA